MGIRDIIKTSGIPVVFFIILALTYVAASVAVSFFIAHNMPVFVAFVLGYVAVTTFVCSKAVISRIAMSRAVIADRATK